MRLVLLTLLLAEIAGAGADPPTALPTAPAGWKLELVAAAPQVRHPSVVCTAPDGRVFVAEDPMDISAPAHLAQGRILCFHPDGRRTVFAEKLFAVFGMQYLEGKLYVLHNPRFSAFTDENGIGKDRLDLIASTNPNPWALDWNDHVPANFRLAMDGFFYVAVGDKGIYGAVGRDGKRVNLHGGGILRLRPDGTDVQVYCTGVRNILDVALDDEDEIFTYDNTDEQQWMGRLTHMVDGGFYGYPYDFIPRRPYTLWMMADYGGGAATGAFGYTEDALPAEYHGNLFLADFGKRQLLRVRVSRQGGTYAAVSREDVFRDPPEDFRPVGIALAPDGLSIYICDWNHRDTKENVVVGRLWKLSYSGRSQAAAKPSWYLPAAMGRPFATTTTELINGLSHPSRNVRVVAQRRLAERSQPRSTRREAARFKNGSQSLDARASADNAVQVTQALCALLKNRPAPAPARWHAIWALDAIDGGKQGYEAILSAASDPDTSVRRQAIRQLGTRRVTAALTILVARLQDADASVRFQAATALGQIAAPAAISALTKALSEPDLFARYAVFTALNRIGRRQPAGWADIARGLEHEHARIREGTMFALRETYDSELLDVLVRIARDPQGSESTREAAIRLLAALHHDRPEWKGEWWSYHPVNSPAPAKTVVWAGTARILNTLREGLEPSSPAVRRACLEGIREAKDAGAAARLCDLFERETDPDLQRLILSALGNLSGSQAMRLIVSVLSEQEKHGGILAEAMVAARNLGGDEIGLAVLKVLRAGPMDKAVVTEALEAIGEIKVRNSGEVVRQYATHGDAEIRSAALKALFKVDPKNALAHLLPLLEVDSPDVRRSAVGAIGRTKSKAALPGLLKAFADPQTRREAMVALAQTPDALALEAYLAGLNEENPATREACRKAIRAIQSEALPLIERQAGRLPSEALRELRKIYEKNERADKLFAAAPKALEPGDYLEFALKHGGNAGAGGKIFFAVDGVGCIKCHAIGAEGGKIGPDLTSVGAQFSRRELADSVLFPSKVVREGYQALIIETKDDEMMSGLFKGETAEEVQLMDNDGKLRRIRKNEIARRKLSDLSMMPEGLQTGLSLQQFADLIAFLESRKAPASE